jgi:pSer/pThr/pTyr-binding forkhead associated (FHA) protein
MSAHHCSIRARCDPETGELRICLMDVSINGTLVNGKPVERHAVVQLADGDVITIGENTRIHLHAAHR